MFRLLKERPRGILSMLKIRINRMVPEPGILAMTIHTKLTGKESENFKPTGYVSSGGESIIYEDTDQLPLDYVSVPAGNVYMTRNCRRLTEKSGRSVYAIHRVQYGSSKHIGIHVPKDIFEQVRSDYEIFRTRSSTSLWRRLHMEYPKMPPIDKTEVHRIISTQLSVPTDNITLQNLKLRVILYARDSYTSYKSLLENQGSLDKRELSEVYERVRDTIFIWRGQDKFLESYHIENGGGIPVSQRSGKSNN